MKAGRATCRRPGHMRLVHANSAPELNETDFYGRLEEMRGSGEARKDSIFRLFLFFGIGLALLCPTEGVVFFSTGDPEFNTTPPTGALTNSGWDMQGYWSLFLGTPVSSNYFISAKH